MKKKLLCMVMVLLFTLSISGCYFMQYSKLKRKESENAKEFFNYLKDEDIDGLVNMFSDDIRDSFDLEECWEEFFDVVDGDIESYDRYHVTYLEQFIDDGKITRCLLKVEFSGVTTDEGVEYDTLEYQTYVVHSDDDQLGLCKIRLRDDDEFLSVIGRSQF